MWWQVFHFPEIILSTGLVVAGTADRGGKFPPGLLPEKIVLRSPVSKITSHSRNLWGGKGPFLAGKKGPPRAAALPYLPSQNLPLSGSGTALLNSLASLTPVHRFLVLPMCYTVNSQLPVGGLSRWLINHGCWDAEPAQTQPSLLTPCSAAQLLLEAAVIQERSSHFCTRMRPA